MKINKNDGLIGTLIGGAVDEAAHLENVISRTIIIALMLVSGIAIYYISIKYRNDKDGEK